MQTAEWSLNRTPAIIISRHLRQPFYIGRTRRAYVRPLCV